MSSGSRRGPKSARCPRGAKRNSAERSSNPSSANSSSTRIRFDNSRRRSSSNSSESTKNSSRSCSSSNSSMASTYSGDSVNSGGNSTWNSKTFLSAEQPVMAPDMSIQHGDRKETYQLADKGKFVMITRKTGDIVYMLRCVDGRRVYIEKTVQGACLILTNKKGKITKALAGAY